MEELPAIGGVDTAALATGGGVELGRLAEPPELLGGEDALLAGGGDGATIALWGDCVGGLPSALGAGLGDDRDGTAAAAELLGVGEHAESISDIPTAIDNAASRRIASLPLVLMRLVSTHWIRYPSLERSCSLTANRPGKSGAAHRER